MSRELSQHLGQEAIRRCLTKQEEQGAWDRKRVMAARWVLTWKHIKEEDRRAAIEKGRAEGFSTVRSDGSAKQSSFGRVGFSTPRPLQDCIACRSSDDKEFAPAPDCVATMDDHIM